MRNMKKSLFKIQDTFLVLSKIMIIIQLKKEVPLKILLQMGKMTMIRFRLTMNWLRMSPDLRIRKFCIQATTTFTLTHME